MAEKHAAVTHSTNYYQFFMQQLWNFVENTQSGILQFVQEGGNYAVKTEGGWWNGSDDLSSGDAFGSDNDYIVIEPVNAYPGGDKWQVKIKSLDWNGSSYTKLTWEVGWLGGYDTSADDFAAGYQTSTVPTRVFYTNTAVNDTWYFSCSNSDTYENSSGTQTYTYLRILLYDSSTATDDDKFAGGYVGGYIPNEPDDDDKPVVTCFGILDATNSSNHWGDVDALGNGQAPGNYAHNTSGGNVSTFINTVSDYYTGYGNTRTGNWSNGPTLIVDYSNNTTLGAFGKYTQMVGDADRTAGATDSNADYKVSANQVFRWNPD